MYVMEERGPKVWQDHYNCFAQTDWEDSIWTDTKWLSSKHASAYQQLGLKASTKKVAFVNEKVKPKQELPVHKFDVYGQTLPCKM